MNRRERNQRKDGEQLQSLKMVASRNHCSCHWWHSWNRECNC
uniref:Uncharacterized protein MANES_10G026800 n=1 Tax=Rhizophora mucronata TaxID=61149 RepID=A0A2P2KDN7_RHIMU